MDLVRSAPGGIPDLSKFAAKLGVGKQRVYDVTNISDGLDLVEKKSKNFMVAGRVCEPVVVCYKWSKITAIFIFFK